MTPNDAELILKAERCIRDVLIPSLTKVAGNYAWGCLSTSIDDRGRFELACRGSEDRAVVEFLEEQIKDAGKLIGQREK